MVVDHLGLRGAVDGIELILTLGLCIGPSHLLLLPLLVAHEDDGGDDHEHWDQGRQGGD